MSTASADSTTPDGTQGDRVSSAWIPWVLAILLGLRVLAQILLLMNSRGVIARQVTYGLLGVLYLVPLVALIARQQWAYLAAACVIVLVSLRLVGSSVSPELFGALAMNAVIIGLALRGWWERRDRAGTVRTVPKNSEPAAGP